MKSESLLNNTSFYATLQQYGIVKSYAQGSIIIQENATMHSLPFVLSGVLKVFRSDGEDKKILLYYLQSGESCVMAFLAGLHQEKSKLQVEVEEAAEILFFPMNKMYLLHQEHPEWFGYIFRLYHKRFEELLAMTSDMAFKKVDERLLELLHKKIHLTGSKIIHLTHEQLASELGTARVVVSRLLKVLEDKKVIKLSRNKIEML